MSIQSICIPSHLICLVNYILHFYLKVLAHLPTLEFSVDSIIVDVFWLGGG